MRPADQESWWPFARVLKDKGYQVLAYDFRGYRDSQGELDIDNIDKDVQAALDFMKSEGVSKVFLIGASMGGTASLKIASGEEVTGVITLSAPPAFEGLDATEDVATNRWHRTMTPQPKQLEQERSYLWKAVVRRGTGGR